MTHTRQPNPAKNLRLAFSPDGRSPDKNLRLAISPDSKLPKNLRLAPRFLRSYQPSGTVRLGAALRSE